MNVLFDVDGLELSRVLCNALAFMPARSRVETARVVVWPDRLIVTATDTYAVGTDFCDVSGTEPFNGFTVELNREGMSALEKIARTDRKKTRMPIRMTYDGQRLTAELGEDAETADCEEPTEKTSELWAACDGLLERLQRSEPALPQTIAFDPSLLSRFAKVKADKTERIADFLIFDNEAPVLVRVGPTFVGAVMPIHRETYAENIGADGLWDGAAPNAA